MQYCAPVWLAPISHSVTPAAAIPVRSTSAARWQPLVGLVKLPRFTCSYGQGQASRYRSRRSVVSASTKPVDAQTGDARCAKSGGRPGVSPLPARAPPSFSNAKLGSNCHIGIRRGAMCSAWCMDYDAHPRPNGNTIKLKRGYGRHAQLHPFQLTIARFYGIYVAGTGLFECMHPFYGPQGSGTCAAA